MPVEANEVPEEGREAGAGETICGRPRNPEHVLPGEIDIERDLLARARGANRSRSLRNASLLDHRKLNTASVRGAIR